MIIVDVVRFTVRTTVQGTWGGGGGGGVTTMKCTQKLSSASFISSTIRRVQVIVT